MSDPRAERFAALDKQLETAEGRWRPPDDRRRRRRRTGGLLGRLVDSLMTLYKLVHGLAAGSDAMLTTTEVADLLGVSRPTSPRLLKAGTSPRRVQSKASFPALGRQG